MQDEQGIQDTPPLRWDGDDGFDQLGRRMVSLTTFTFRPADGGDGRLHWQAYVATELVWSGDVARFPDRASAKDAAEDAYVELFRAAGYDLAAMPAFPAPTPVDGKREPGLPLRIVQAPWFLLRSATLGVTRRRAAARRQVVGE